MNSMNYEELNNVLEQLCDKRDDLQDQIDNNSLMILEMDSANAEDGESDALFSPRKKSSARYQKAKREQDKSDFLEQNNQLFLERNKINSLIDILQRVLEEEMSDEEDPEASSEDSEESEDEAEKSSEEDSWKESKDDGSKDGSGKDDADSQEDAAKSKRKSRKNFPAQDLSRLVRKIEQARKFIDQDPHRAKLELDSIKKKMNKLIEAISCEKEKS